MTEGTDALRTARKQLQRRIRGEKSVGNARCMLKYFSPKDYAEVEDALVKQGGGRGVQIKEEGCSASSRPRRSEVQIGPNDEPSGGPSNR